MRCQSYDVDSLYLYAHNEYLQGLAEAGGIGFLPGLIFASLLLRHALKSHQAVAAACAAAIVAAMVDGFVEFGVRLPANALVLAWIAGVAARTTAAATLPSIAPLALNAGLVACSFGYAFLGWVPSVTASPPHRRAEALRLEPSSPDRWLDLAEAASDQGDQTTARLAVKQALRLGGNLPPALLRAFDLLSQ